MTSLSCRLVTTIAGLQSLQADWDRLHVGNPELTMFNSWTWCFQWWQSYGDEHRLHVIVCTRESVADGEASSDEVVGIAPLYIARHRASKVLRNDSVLFLGSGGDTSPDYHNFIVGCKGDVAETGKIHEALIKFLVTQAGYDSLALGDMLVGSTLHGLATSHQQFGPGAVRLEAPKAISYTPLPKTMTAYRQGLSRNSRKHLKRRKKRMEEARDLGIEIVTSTDATLNAFESLVGLHLARWQDKGQIGTFRTERYLQFHRGIIRQFSAQGNIWMVVLRHANTIIGVEYLFRYGKRLFFFQTGFSPDYNHLAPGHLMIAHAIEKAIEEGLAEIDLLKGEYDYKQSYAPLTRYTQGVFWYRPGPLSLNIKLRSWLGRQRDRLKIVAGAAAR